jgi:hypothetical protein
VAKSNEGQMEPHNFPNANQGQGTKAKKNASMSGPKSVPVASSIFRGPKQEYSGVMEKNTNKKAGSF